MGLPYTGEFAALCAVQAAAVALPARRSPPLVDRLRSRWWSLVPIASIVGAIAALDALAATADGLTWLALVATPPLAALALGWAARGARPPYALAVVPLFALAWTARGELSGQAAALAISALSAVTLGVLLAAAAPPGWLKLGIVLMAAADAYLVFSDLLREPNAVLNAAAPPAGLPQLQRAELGRAVMGYGDLFVAGVLGGVLAVERRRQVPAAMLTLLLALLFALLFYVVDELPSTVPVAATLILLELRARARRPRPRPAVPRSPIAASGAPPRRVP